MKWLMDSQWFDRMEVNTPTVVAMVALSLYSILYWFVLKNDKFIRNKIIKYLSLLLYVAILFFIGVYIFEDGTLEINKHIVFMFLTVFMLMIAIDTILIAFFHKSFIDLNSSKERVIILFVYLSIIFFCFSFMHYVVYWVNPDSFIFDGSGQTWFDIVISFLHYSFSTSITYSTSGIEPNNSLTKILSMVQISFFYLILGESLFGELQERTIK